MKKIATTLIVLICFFSAETVAQNQDNFESLMATLQDKDSRQIIYTVQIGSFRNNPKKGHFDNVENMFSHKYSDGLTRYFSRLFKDQAEAIEYRNRLRIERFSDAFLLGLDGGFDRILLEVD
ncbi:MAG: SPOR domain-containing protein [Bacteroidia bacterium]|nr:SPOR domain-containing protein [Bacteroidia bacterium]NND10667.1 hypothetical protein [Flavobacteriaceae bacterium]MBT8308748.1 SPOR domain-containing protein [Bacteroidia bacterium]NNK28686.1 hypothetical protein [Flavobacteriaceae bacterium]NNL59900.1 hypothetical protein [Flavobacteriaceae bacterium]